MARQIPVIKELSPASISVFPEIAGSQPKISRGEKYLGLPWVMLDYPAVFAKHNVFAVRTMFWWGNFFSVTLHISGTYKAALLAKLNNSLKQTKDIPFYISNAELEWDHHFEETNYQPIHLAIQDHLSLLPAADFIKIALKFPLNELDRMENNLLSAYRNIFALLQ